MDNIIKKKRRPLSSVPSPTSDIIPDKRGSRKNQSRIAPHQKEQMMREFKKYGGPRPKGSVSEGGKPKDKRELRPVKGAKSTKHKHTWDRRNMNIGGRANLLEEMGRIDARKHPDAADRAEKRRVISELNKGYNKGGKATSKEHKKGSFKRKKPRPFPQPGTYDYFLQEMHKPGYKKENKASGGLIKGKPKLAKKGWK